MTILAWTAAGLLLVLAVLAAVATRVTRLERPVRSALVAAEALVAFIVVADIGLLLRADAADRPESMVTHVGYAVAAAGLLPALVWRAPAQAEDDPDTDQASLWVVAIALVAVAVCVLRLVQTR
ncbi:hypothetical protein [Nocardioides coralli]|uniref:hypothetical protein n=1 Tax=Nocardioides coralli TaxID=2872154 RepID=UPI001CA44A5E|nr:hypothetical protein [Nocardioides coralli]QZY30243.1 hypothetical protein K6T13_06105 [Nocardioides coralli]